MLRQNKNREMTLPESATPKYGIPEIYAQEELK